MLWLASHNLFAQDIAARKLEREKNEKLALAMHEVYVYHNTRVLHDIVYALSPHHENWDSASNQRFLWTNACRLSVHNWPVKKKYSESPKVMRVRACLHILQIRAYLVLLVARRTQEAPATAWNGSRSGCKRTRPASIKRCSITSNVRPTLWPVQIRLKNQESRKKFLAQVHGEGCNFLLVFRIVHMSNTIRWLDTWNISIANISNSASRMSSS